jgi:hypothetical protein
LATIARGAMPPERRSKLFLAKRRSKRL